MWFSLLILFVSVMPLAKRYKDNKSTLHRVLLFIFTIPIPFMKTSFSYPEATNFETLLLNTNRRLEAMENEFGNSVLES